MKRSAFTLLEMIIAITVFTIFIGFAISTYLMFHRADQEALAMRSLMLETQGTMDLISDAVKENTIDYAYYNDGLSSDVLALRSPDGQTETVFIWDEEVETLSLFTIDENDVASSPVLLHSETTRVPYVHFRIFPDKNPYENSTEEAIQYQPTVQMEITFSMPGRVQEEITVDFQTSITSRFYQ
ncbi:MAG: type II secretion system protein [Patescibacteria group bacterium]